MADLADVPQHTPQVKVEDLPPVKPPGGKKILRSRSTASQKHTRSPNRGEGSHNRSASVDGAGGQRHSSSEGPGRPPTVSRTSRNA